MYLNQLQHDDLYVPTAVVPLKDLTQMPTRRGLEQAIISNGAIVNVVSKSYGHIPNDLFFKQAEQLLHDAELPFETRSINREDRSFVMDIIVKDANQFTVKHEADTILPMLRFKNSYDGSERTSGHFGFYRKICNNGLHVAQSEIDFAIKHNKNNTTLILPKLNHLFQKFLDNEFYSIVHKFNRMKSVKIMDTEAFVKAVLEEHKLFRYECSDTNDNPSKRSRMVIDIIDHESLLLQESPNLWLGYNAFNEVLHNTLKRSFSQQERLDRRLFDTVLNMAT